MNRGSAGLTLILALLYTTLSPANWLPARVHQQRVQGRGAVMKGNLKDFSPTQLLSLVSLARKTGRLSIERKGIDANLVFRDGKLVYASINGTDGTLASVLGRSGRISEAQAAKLAGYSRRATDKQLGLMLIQKGYVSQGDIINSIKRHAVTAINEFASWDDGRFEFYQDEQPNPGLITVPLDLENVIVQIARRQKRDEQLMDEIPSLDVALKFVQRPNVKLSDLQLSRDEWRVLNFIKPGNTVAMIARRLEMEPMEIRRVVGSLREAGLIELAHAQRREQLSTEEKRRRRTLVRRLIEHIQNLGSD